jgi:YVTN family beta-propeller protein
MKHLHLTVSGAPAAVSMYRVNVLSRNVRSLLGFLSVCSLVAIFASKLAAQGVPVDSTAPLKLGSQGKAAANSAHPPGSAPRIETKGNQASKAMLIDEYGRLPLRFEPNQGNSNSQMKFVSRDIGRTLFLSPQNAVLVLEDAHQRRASLRRPPVPPLSSAKVVQMRLLGANPQAGAVGLESLPGATNYFIGSDAKRWRTNVRAFGKVRFEDLYPGIDLVYYGDNQRLEYDFVVAPGADPAHIRMNIRGAAPSLDQDGNAVISSGDKIIRLLRPSAYQKNDGQKREIQSRFVLTGRTLRFWVGNYDRNKRLVIDPVLSYSTYLGGSGGDGAASIAVDPSGNAYIAGTTDSADFPVSAGSFQVTHTGTGGNVFVAKLNPAGTALIYATYIGGSGQYGDLDAGIAIDSSGDAFLTGTTNSTDFPITPGAFQKSFAGGQYDAFITELNPSGAALLYSTYLGGQGSDGGASIAVDSSGNAYVTGNTTSTNFPVTSGAPQSTLGGGTYDAFVAKVNPLGSALAYSTYLGGSGDDFGGYIAVDPSGEAYVAGSTGSANFPLTAGALQTAYGGGPDDVFVTKLTAAGTALAYSTYLGGSGDDYAGGVVVDAQGNFYVTGSTGSTNFPVTAGAFQSVFGGGPYDAFVSEFAPSGSSLIYSTYLGGTGDDDAGGLTLDSAGDAYVTGYTSSADFPLSSPIQSSYGGNPYDVFVTELNGAGSSLLLSTYLGGSGDDEGLGIALDGANSIYIVGYTTSQNFPLNSPLQSTNKSYPNSTGFVAKLSSSNGTIGSTPTSCALAPSSSQAMYGQPVTITATVSTQSGSPTGWVSFYEGSSVIGQSVLVGGQAAFTVSLLPVGTHSITATYSGDSTFAQSTSAPVSATITQAGSSTSVFLSPTAILVDQAVALTAAVTSNIGNGVPTGTVAFYYNQQSLGSAALVLGSATLSVASLPAGKDSITAVYHGDANFTGSTSAPVFEIVFPGLPTFSPATIPVGTGPVAMAYNPATNTLYVANQGSNNVSVINAATIAVIGTIPVGTTPTGIGVNPATNRIYVADSGSADVAVIDGSSNTLLTTIPLQSVTPFPQAISVDSERNLIFVGSASSTVLMVIDGSTNSISYPDPTGSFGPIASVVSPVTDRVYVASYEDSAVETYQGTEFLSIYTSHPGRPSALAADPVAGKIYVADGVFPLSTMTGNVDILDESNGTITPVLSGLNPYSVAADPPGGIVYVANQSGAAGLDATLTAIDASTDKVTNTFMVGQTQVPASIPTPNKVAVDSANQLVYVANEASNDVSVIYNNPQVTSLVGTVSTGNNPRAVLVSNVCTIFVSNFGSGTLSYFKPGTNGPAICLSSSFLAFGPQTIGSQSAPQSVTVTNIGTSTLSITDVSITGNFSETTNCALPTGSVQIAPGQSCAIQVAFLPTAAGIRKGQVSIASNVLNSPTLISLAGDGVAATTTQLAVVPNPSVYGQPLTLTATVASTASGTPTGPVQFLLNGAVLTTVLLGANGAATFTTNFPFLLPVGSTESFSAVYEGDVYFAASTSPAVSQIINKASTNVTSVYATPNPPTDPQKLNATVGALSPGGGIPTGKVVFQEGQTILGTAGLDSTGAAVVPTYLPGGPHTVSVTYLGDSNFNASSAAQPLNLSVPISTVTTVSASPAGPIYTSGTTVTLTVTITASSAAGGNLGGSVELWDGPNFLTGVGLRVAGTTMSGSLTIPGPSVTQALGVGQHSITAVFQDQGSIFLPSKSSPLILTVTPSGSAGGCACSLTGNYVDPVAPVETSSALLSPNGMYTQTPSYDTSNPATGASVSVVRNSDQKTVLSLTGLPSNSNFGFSPDDGRFVVHYLTGNSGSQFDNVTVYDLTSGQILVTTTSPVGLVSSALLFSPSGRYFLYEFIYDNNGSNIGHLQIFQVQGVASQYLMYDSGDFLLINAPTPDGIGAASQGFSPGTPETTFEWKYLTGATQSTWNLVSLIRQKTVLTTGSLTDVSDVWKYSPCGDIIALMQQYASGTPVANINLYSTATGSLINPSGYGVGTINGLLITCTATGQFIWANGTLVTPPISTDTSCSNTPTGTNVAVVPADSGGSGLAPATVTFASVSASGSTTLVASSASGQTAPAGFELGNPPTVYDLATTATFTSAEVCISYAGISFGSSNLTLLHFENGQWVDHTIQPIDTVHQIICANVTSFSPFEVAEHVSTEATSTNLASSASTLTFGQPVTFTVTVISTAGVPTGTVTFLDGATTLGTGTLDANGTATLTLSSLGVGLHALMATYVPSGPFAASSSSAASLVIGQAAPTITWTTPAAITYGTPLSASQLNAVASVPGTFTYTPGSGTVLSAGAQSLSVTFTPTDATDYSSATSIVSLLVNKASTTITLVNLNQTYTGSALAPAANTLPPNLSYTVTGAPDTNAGTYSVTATINDSNYMGSANGTFVINKITPTISINNMPASAIVGGNFTPAYLYAGDGTPSVTSSTPACSAVGAVISFVGAGGCTLTAHASAGTNYAAATGPAQSLTVSPAATSITLQSSANPAIIATPLIFSAFVVSSAGVPSGNVTFYDGVLSVGTASLIAGEATFTTSSLSAGTHSITAVYVGSANFSASTSAILSEVLLAGKVLTQTTLNSSANPSYVGRAVTFLATVTDTGNMVPNGIVTFKLGTNVVGTGSLDANGHAVFTTSTLPVGADLVSATYSGSAVFNTSSSSVLQDVDRYPTTLALGAVPNPGTYGQSITFAAKVTSSAGIPAGSVIFVDNLTPIGTVNLDSTGSATLVTKALSGGIHAISAAYTGNGTLAPSASALVATIKPAATTTRLVSSANPATVGTSITFTVTVASTAATPNGTVTFFSGSTALGQRSLTASGIASLSISSLGSGTHAITANFLGNLDFNASSATISEVVR